ncbi:MAG: SHOCT domain-containing protein [Acidobacteria bacterium]|nr:SHOCT domain-containing protein [Acidobacteriota bacterium]
MPLLDLFWSMLWIFLFIIWIWLLISVFIDIFRADLSGWGKALWVIFVIVLPFLGVLVYLIVHGGDMQKRATDRAVEQQAAQAAYVQNLAGSGSAADELDKLKGLHDRGVLTDDEFAAQKQKVLAS